MPMDLDLIFMEVGETVQPLEDLALLYLLDQVTAPAEIDAPDLIRLFVNLGKQAGMHGPGKDRGKGQMK